MTHAPQPTTIDLAIAPAAAIAARPGVLEHLDAVERARFGRLRHPADRLRFLAGRALLRELVGRHADVDPAAVRFAIDGRGRVRLAEPRAHATALDVSIAHAGGAVVAAVAAGGRVGIDLEPAAAARDLETIALTPAERHELLSLPVASRPGRLLEAWTAKEAYAKLTGHGLCLDFTRLSVARLASRERLTLRTFVAQVGGRPYRVGLAAWSRDAVADAGDAAPRIRLATVDGATVSPDVAELEAAA